ncbi:MULTISPECIES: FAD-binding oxidoreductase [Microbacterium]|uniref:FAD-binding oxidoreductase n=2 Tax=Microbacterium maritypicum TaxID=33918 RepID=A0AAJ5SK82_MICMQ|nr:MULTISPECIES: FAD-binding oxidoreductase [Microbacterium]EYT61315.1 FAD-linked oxidoreductase [Microbacterium sp. UCD-TDU]MBP5801161.1 FAD-binding oxidoreductase [Microbacterium liquefaciens]UTT51880.1 FAD-binding oxidoreductase [Microbacterium liquefaciens]WEF19937.1 FAD-binding oxidoreductase [Microbacterium liquefaciens]
MVASRSALTRAEIVDRLRDLIGDDQVDTDARELREASVDRFKKYTSVHGIFDGPIPAAIAYARSTEDVSAILSFAEENLINIVPRTGRTATEGGLETIVEDTIVLDGSRMDAILEIDPIDMMVTAQCGVPLQVLEDTLRAQGLTTGHSPQSKPLAQMGGLVATRSIGQFSTLYGGIEDMVVGLEAVLPGGRVTRIKNVPRRAAGPDIRHIVIGNEGALCVITEVTVKVFRYQPENNRFLGYLVDSLPVGVAGLREIIVAGYHPSVARAYSEEDAAQHFSHFADGKAVVVVVTEGPKAIADATADGVEAIFAGIPHEKVDPALIENWFDNLNWGQDKIDAEKREMLEKSHLGYTTEVSIDWSGVAELFDSVMRRARTEFPHAADLTMLGAHSSHSYQTGTNLYFVYDYDISCEPREEITVYHEPLNAIVVEEALRLGGSMVHHHGIGKYRTPWTLEEHGSAFELLRVLKDGIDPHGIMNHGTIYPLDAAETASPA